MKEPLPSVLENRPLLADVFTKPWSKSAAPQDTLKYSCVVSNVLSLGHGDVEVLNALFSTLGIGEMEVKEYGDNADYILCLNAASYHKHVVPIQKHFASDLAKCGRLTDWAKHIYTSNPVKTNWVDKAMDHPCPQIQR